MKYSLYIFLASVNAAVITSIPLEWITVFQQSHTFTATVYGPPPGVSAYSESNGVPSQDIGSSNINTGGSGSVNTGATGTTASNQFTTHISGGTPTSLTSQDYGSGTGNSGSSATVSSTPPTPWSSQSGNTNPISSNNGASSVTASGTAPLGSTGTTSSTNAGSSASTTISPSTNVSAKSSSSPDTTPATSTSTTPSSTSPSSTTSTAPLGTFEAEILSAHNAKRGLYDIPPLVWDPTLAAFADNFVKNFDCANIQLVHSGGPYGENIAAGTLTPVDNWYAEIANYDYTNPVFSSDTSHFTQLVWKSTSKLGCGRLVCNNFWKQIVVCEYDPRGNMQGIDPVTGSNYYVENVLPLL